jgi:hypothetical protein
MRGTKQSRMSRSLSSGANSRDPLAPPNVRDTVRNSDGFREGLTPSDRAHATSGQEFYAVGLAATPDHFAGLAFWMRRHERQCEPAPEIDLDIGLDPDAARRDVQYEAIEPGHAVVDRDPGRLLVHLPARLARHLYPWHIDSHDDHPLLDVSAIGKAIASAVIKFKVIS